MDINVKSPFFLTQALHGLLKGGGSADHPAKVINIGSIDGQRLNPWETYSYHASKAAILYLTKRLAARLVQDHILVTAIAPGAFQSDMNKAARDHGDAVAKSIPVKRIGVPEDMAGAAIRSEEHTSELQSLMRNSYAVFCLKKKTNTTANR